MDGGRGDRTPGRLVLEASGTHQRYPHLVKPGRNVRLSQAGNVPTGSFMRQQASGLGGVVSHRGAKVLTTPTTSAQTSRRSASSVRKLVKAPETSPLRLTCQPRTPSIPHALPPISDQDLLTELVRGGAPEGKIRAEGFSPAELARARAQVAAELHAKRERGQSDGSADER